MIRKPQDQDRNLWLDRLNPLRRTPQPVQQAAGYPVPPSRKNRKALTTWQDEAAVRRLKHIANEQGISQQALIAEGINYVLAKYGEPGVAT
jgi:hypothetical protein